MADGLIDGLGFGDLEAESEEGSSRWIHVPAKERLRVVILSERAYRYEGHWVNGRMRVCPGPGCAWHARRMGVQVRYCLSVLDVDARIRAFLEVGAITAKQIASSASEAGRLRGLIFTLRHEGEKKTGRLLALPEDAWSALALLPPAEEPGGQIARQAAAERSTMMPAAWEPPGLPVDAGAGGRGPSRNGRRQETEESEDANQPHSLRR